MQIKGKGSASDGHRVGTGGDLCLRDLAATPSMGTQQVPTVPCAWRKTQRGWVGCKGLCQAPQPSSPVVWLTSESLSLVPGLGSSRAVCGLLQSCPPVGSAACPLRLCAWRAWGGGHLTLGAAPG